MKQEILDLQNENKLNKLIKYGNLSLLNNFWKKYL